MEFKISKKAFCTSNFHFKFVFYKVIILFVVLVLFVNNSPYCEAAAAKGLALSELSEENEHQTAHCNSAKPLSEQNKKVFFARYEFTLQTSVLIFFFDIISC